MEELDRFDAEMAEIESTKNSQIMGMVFAAIGIAVFTTMFPIVMQMARGWLSDLKAFLRFRLSRHHRWPLPPRKIIQDSQFYPITNSSRLCYATSYQGMHLMASGSHFNIIRGRQGFLRLRKEEFNA